MLQNEDRWFLSICYYQPDLLEAAKAVVNKVMRAGFAQTCLDDTGIHEAIAKANGREQCRKPKASVNSLSHFEE